MRTKLVNHVYWGSNNFFAYGTRLKVNPDQSVDFWNGLMSAGQSIIDWNSVYNYQGSKIVPQLPILLVGHEYRLVAHLTSTPERTHLIRLTFYDIQGSEIKREEFNSDRYEFILPEGTTSYSISILNSGMTAMHFDRIDICESDLPDEANDLVWPHQPLNVKEDENCQNLLLVRDAKQFRQTYPELVEEAGGLPVQVISIGWQGEEKLASLQQVIDGQPLKNVRVISTDPGLDNLAQQLKRNNYGIKTMINDQSPLTELADATWPIHPFNWYSPAITEPDWHAIIQAVKKTWGEVKN